MRPGRPRAPACRRSGTATGTNSRWSGHPGACSRRNAIAAATPTGSRPSAPTGASPCRPGRGWASRSNGTGSSGTRSTVSPSGATQTNKMGGGSDMARQTGVTRRQAFQGAGGLAALALAGAPVPARAAPGNIVRHAVSADHVNSLDPSIVIQNADANPSRQIFDALIDPPYGTFDLTPAHMVTEAA